MKIVIKVLFTYLSYAAYITNGKRRHHIKTPKLQVGYFS